MRYRICLTIFLMFAAVADINAASSPVAIDGWDKAKFGMTIDAIEKIYPAGKRELESSVSKECSQQAGEEPLDFFPTKSPFSCYQYRLDNHKVGFDTVTVNFIFSAYSGRLAQVKIRSKAGSEAYQQYH